MGDPNPIFATKSVKSGKPQNEHNISASPSIAEVRTGVSLRFPGHAFLFPGQAMAVDHLVLLPVMGKGAHHLRYRVADLDALFSQRCEYISPHSKLYLVLMHAPRWPLSRQR
jgi:hypothetical protein